MSEFLDLTGLGYFKNKLEQVKADKDTDAVEGNLAKFDASGNPVDAGIAAEKVAKKGEIQTFAGNLVDTRSAGTPQGPYAFRQSGGDGVDYMVRIKGRTEAFNQLVGDNDTEVTVPSGHQYFAIIGGTASVATSDGSPISVTGGVDIVVDLTLEGLGFTTADQFRALHPLGYYNPMSKLLNNAATGIKSRGFNKWDEVWEVGGYIIGTGAAYSDTDRIRSKNAIPVLPGTAYYFSNNNTHALFFYDASGNYISDTGSVGTHEFTTPANCAYIKFNLYSTYGTTYNHDICINLSDASRNGEYEPYWERTLALGLNSIPCHDENNNAVVVNGLDGVGTAQDELIVENGWGTKIIKRYAKVIFNGTEDWEFPSSLAPYPYYAAVQGLNDNSQIPACNMFVGKQGSNGFPTGGECKLLNGPFGIAFGPSEHASTIETWKTYLAGLYSAGTPLEVVYPVATPKVLTLDNPFPAFVEVDNLGTEKRLPEDTADNPQGPFECDSNYSISTANLLRKLNS